MTKGFLILSHGKEDYEKFAFNLASSIRMTGCNLPIAVLTDYNGEKFKYPWKSPFDRRVLIEEKHKRAFYVKTQLYDYSPFDKTIYLDADTLCFNNPEYLFDKLEGKPFAVQKVKEITFHTRAECYTAWADVGMVYNHYKVPKEFHYSETNTSIMYFEKGKEAKKVFQLFEHFYAAEPFPHYRHETFGTYPDELALGIALLHINYRLPDLHPIFFFSHDQGIPDKDEADNYPFIGFWGVNTHRYLWNWYDRWRSMDCGRVYGEYGPKLGYKNKWSNTKRTTIWRGLREGERPAEIQEIIDEFLKVKAK